MRSGGRVIVRVFIKSLRGWICEYRVSQGSASWLSHFRAKITSPSQSCHGNVPFRALYMSRSQSCPNPVPFRALYMFGQSAMLTMSLSASLQCVNVGLSHVGGGRRWLLRSLNEVVMHGVS